MQDTAIDPNLGKMIRGYCLEELLQRGDLMAVYRARTEELWQPSELIITILLLPETLPERMLAQFKVRFMREARQLALLRHQYLLPLYGYGEQDGLFYLLTPLPAPGKTLEEHLSKKGRWSPREALSTLAPLAAVFEHIHSQGLVCQFFHPATILLLNDQSVLLSCLGLSRLVSVKGLSEETADVASYEHLKSIAGTFLGAPEYLAPEVLKGEEADRCSDVYTLGILLFQLLNGEPPFSGQSYLEIAQKHVKEPVPSLHVLSPDLPAALELVVNRALHRTPERRFQTPGEFIAAYTRTIDERVNVSLPVDLSSAIEQTRAQLSPDAWTATDLLAERENTLYAAAREREVPTASAASAPESLRAPSSPQTSPYREAERRETQVDLTEVAGIDTMIDQIHQLKERLQVQARTFAARTLEER